MTIVIHNFVIFTLRKVWQGTFKDTLEHLLLKD